MTVHFIVVHDCQQGLMCYSLQFLQLADASTLKEDVVSGVDIMIVRELVGGIYFGQPRVSPPWYCDALPLLITASVAVCSWRPDMNIGVLL